MNSAAQYIEDPNHDAQTISYFVFIWRNMYVYGVNFRAVKERYSKKYGGMQLPKDEEPFVSEDNKQKKSKSHGTTSPHQRARGGSSRGAAGGDCLRQ